MFIFKCAYVVYYNKQTVIWLICLMNSLKSDSSQNYLIHDV